MLVYTLEMLKVRATGTYVVGLIDYDDGVYAKMSTILSCLIGQPDMILKVSEMKSRCDVFNGFDYAGGDFA